MPDDERGVLTVGLLGPLQVTLDGRPVALTAGRLRTVLATLALAAGTAVSIDRLATALWYDRLPDHPRRGVQTYLTRLRMALGVAGLIGTGPSGYTLHTDPEQVDALRFGRLLDAAAAATDPGPERALLAEALTLWRGDPFDDLRSDWLSHTETPRLVERYLSAIERQADLDLAAGHHAALAARLQELTRHHPLREPLWVRLLTVLQRCGRSAEALEQYALVRHHLADQLGTDPGPELQRIHADLLAGRPTSPRARARAELPASRPVPRQLPADLAVFTGRIDALRTLHELLPRAGDSHRATMVISTITGTAGVGKTTLALHWAHQVADRFPDGQLYVNLRGYHPSGQAMAPAEAVGGFLDALGVPAAQIPADLDAQTALYRSLLAGRRMLIVLDNTRDPEQVRPLLPGSPGCLVVTTSRNPLTTLIAAHAAHPLTLDLLTTAEARQLLARRIGADRVRAEPDAATAIVTRCARLPLALAIAAARASTRPQLPLRRLADDLANLDTFQAGGSSFDVRAVFSWSYGALGPAPARLFRLLGLHPGPDLALPAAASLAALSPPDTRRLLGELCDAHLLTEHRPGRYALHDLLRAYAMELAEANEPAEERQAACHRTLEHYLHTANVGAMRMVPNRDPISLPPVAAGVCPENLDDHHAAASWFVDEHAVLLALTTRAHQAGFDRHCWQLAWAITTAMDRRGRWQELTGALRLALAATDRSGDPLGLAFIHRCLALAEARLVRFDHARRHLERALAVFRQLGDLPNQARTALGLAQVLGRQGRPAEALEQARTALATYRAAGHRAGEAEALNGVGWYHTQLGDHRQALVHCEQALVILQEVGDRRAQAGTQDTIGLAHHHLGDHGRATDYFRQAIACFRELGESFYEADTLTHLSDAHLAGGDLDAARDALGRALSILRGLGHPDAAQLGDRIAALGGVAACGPGWRRELHPAT